MKSEETLEALEREARDAYIKALIERGRTVEEAEYYVQWSSHAEQLLCDKLVDLTSEELELYLGLLHLGYTVEDGLVLLQGKRRSRK